MKKKLFLALVLSVVVLFSGVSLAKAPIVISDREHDSIRIHDRIVAYILTYGYGYEYEFLPTTNTLGVAGLLRGDLDISMEIWVENMQEAYDKMLAAGVQDLGANFPDSWQGWLIPTYTAKKYNIKSVFDMNKHWELFKNPENPRKGRFHSGIPGWFCTIINQKKIDAYGLDNYNVFVPGSNAALSSSMVSAYKRHKPWFGYYWSPTWVLGKLDMYKLEEAPFDQEKWDNGFLCSFPSVRVNILVSAGFVENYPDVVEFLKKYETTQEINNKFLAYQRELKGRTNVDSAIWFLENYKDLWTKWLPVGIAVKVEQALNKGKRIKN